MNKESLRSLGRTIAHFHTQGGGKMLLRAWAEERERIIKQGFKHQSSEDWAELKGFQRAVNIYEGAIALVRMDDQEKEEE